MIRLNSKLLLLSTNETLQGTIGISSDLLYQHTFSAWVQFLELGRVTRVNLGVLAQWEDDSTIERLMIEDRARRIFHTQVEIFAELKNDYYFITAEIINKTLDILDRQDYYYFDYYAKKSSLVAGESLLKSNCYYGQFVNNMFSIPVHFARQNGVSYYFVQEIGDCIIVPNVVSLEHSESIIDSWVQKLNLAKPILWQNFRKYVRKTFGVDIKYGKPEPKSSYNRKFATRWRATRK